MISWRYSDIVLSIFVGSYHIPFVVCPYHGDIFLHYLYLLQNLLVYIKLGEVAKGRSEISVLAPRHDDDDDIKAKIDKAPQNSKCRFCGDKDKTINHIRSERCKIAQKEDDKSRHNCVGKLLLFFSFSGVSTLFGSFNADLNFKHFSLI